MAELVNCPYCGGEAMLFQQGCGTVSPCEIWRKLALRCGKCGAEPFEQIEVRARIDADGNVVVSGNRDEVIDKWNRRADTIVPAEGVTEDV